MRPLFAVPLLAACNHPQKAQETIDPPPGIVSLCDPETEWSEVTTVSTETADGALAVVNPAPSTWLVEKTAEKDLTEDLSAATNLESETVAHDPATPPAGVAYENIDLFTPGSVPWESTLYADGTSDPETIAESIHPVFEEDEYTTTAVSGVECLNISGGQLCGMITTFNGETDAGETNGSPLTDLLLFGITTEEENAHSLRITATTGEYFPEVDSWSSGWTAALSELPQDHVFRTAVCSAYSSEIIKG